MNRIKFLHNVADKTVTVTFREYLFRTDDPAESAIALDAKGFCFVAGLTAEDYNAEPQRYALYAPEDDTIKVRFGNYAAMLVDNINEQGVYDLMRRGVVTLDYIASEIVLTFPEDFYSDYAADNGLPTLEQLPKEAAQ